MVVENAELQLKLSSFEKLMSCSLDNLQHRVTKLNMELTGLKCCVDDNFSSSAGDIHLILTNNNSSSTDVIS